MKEMIDRLAIMDEYLADAACAIIADIDEIQTARQFIDTLFEHNMILAEQVLDAISDSYHDNNLSGSWKDDGENMILLTWDELDNEMSSSKQNINKFINWPTRNPMETKE